MATLPTMKKAILSCIAVNRGGAVPTIATAFRHCGMACDMLKDLRKRIEATESARTFEYTIQLAARTAKYFADMGALHDKLAAQAHSPQTDSLREGAKFWSVRADDLAKTNSATAKYFENATADDLLRKHNIEQIEKYRDDTLVRGCGAIEDMSNFIRTVDGARAKLTAEVGQALDGVEADEAMLKPDCSSEHAISLVKKTGKPPSN